MRHQQLQRVLKQPVVTFDEVKHTYTGPNGELYTGCSTISEAWAKDFLGPWNAKEAVKYLGWYDVKEDGRKLPEERIKELNLNFLERFDAFKKMREEEFFEELYQAKGAAYRKGKEAQEQGTEAHDWMEKAVNVKILGEGKIPSKPKTKEVQNAVKAFVEWAKQHKIEWLASEEIVNSEVHKVGGTLDAIAVIDGLTYLVDFKTSKQISPSYLLQCAGYDLMLREMGLQVMGYLVLRLPKDGSPAETLTITDQKDMEFFRETFLKQREAHKFYVYMENKFKEAGRMKVDLKELVEPKGAGEKIKTKSKQKK